MFNWPLAVNSFTFLDRLKICSFFLNSKNRWTQDKYVKEYEKIAAKYVGAKYAVFVSSGSAANQLICQEIKDRLIKNGEWPLKNKVIVSAVTWQTNVSVWVREGFEPIFIDPNLEDFSINYYNLIQILEDKDNLNKIACIFPTSVLGYTPDLDLLKFISQRFQVEVKLDNCENFFGEYSIHDKKYNINSLFTSSASCFIAHHITTGSEGGFIFTNSEKEYEYYLLSRAHGLLRNLDQYQISQTGNKLVDKQFDFQTLSSNYRSSDINAFMGILDFRRADEYKKYRNKIYSIFKNSLDKNKYLLPENREWTYDCAFCLPIICKHPELLGKVKEYLDSCGIEKRGFISGNMLRQTPYQKYANYKDFPNAEFLNNNAIYIGLHQKVTEKMIIEITSKLNNI